MSNHYDCIIAGAGIVGLTLALALARKKFNVALVDAKNLNFPEKTPEAFDIRVSAITRASERIFKNLQIWDSLCEDRIAPFNKMRVWEQQGKGLIEFNAKLLSEPNLGHIIENNLIRKHLYAALKKFSNVHFFLDNPAEDLFHLNDNIHLQLQQGETLSARLLVGADGAKSWLRQRAEFTLEEKNYNHHAIVATIKTELKHDFTARQRFLSEGILAFLPLADPHHHSIVWSSSEENTQKLMAMDDETFGVYLNDAYSSVLGKVTLESQRFNFPLFMRHAKNYVKPRIALVGDAAHTVHPLAGQGVNLGLLDAASLVDVICDTHAKDRDFGLLQHLRKYERSRKGDNQLMLFAMAGFKNLFDKESSAIVWARNMGLSLTDKAEPVKNLFIKKAMGLMGELPALAKANYHFD